MYDQEHLGKATLNPARRFRRPIDVVEAVGMTAIEKRTILKAWEADERALQRAEVAKEPRKTAAFGEALRRRWSCLAP